VSQTTLSVRLCGKGLGKRFGAVTALESVDIDLQDGEALAILGPNGAGKSTLLRLLAGLARPSSGSLELATAEGAQLVARRRGAARRAVGFAGHATMLYPELSARENLIFHGRLQGIASPATRADALLEAEGLTRFAERQAGTFSRGMAQRLTIARALVHDPPLLLLDEPFTGLDQRAGDRLCSRLIALRGEGRAIALVTHDLHRASEIATSALVLLGGRVAARATGADLTFDALQRTYSDALDRLAAHVSQGALP
jgi:heme exporter protein A